MANNTGKKFGGRKPGSPNKTTRELKQIVQDFLQKNAEDLQRQYTQLEAKDKLAFFEKLLKFAIPTQQQSRIDFEKMSDEDLDSVINSLKQHVQ